MHVISPIILTLSLFLLGKRFVAKGNRLMKCHHLMDEVEKSIEDKTERGKVLEGLLGYILSSTQVIAHNFIRLEFSAELTFH